MRHTKHFIFCSFCFVGCCSQRSVKFNGLLFICLRWKPFSFCFSVFWWLNDSLFLKILSTFHSKLCFYIFFFLRFFFCIVFRGLCGFEINSMIKFTSINRNDRNRKKKRWNFTIESWSNVAVANFNHSKFMENGKKKPFTDNGRKSNRRKTNGKRSFFF